LLPEHACGLDHAEVAGRELQRLVATSLTSEPLAGQEPWPPPVPTAPKHGWKPTCVIWVPVVVFRMRSAPVSNE
jgi:hypothetical protein